MFATYRTYSRAASRSSGFTLVELMITIAVASVLLAVAVPSFNGLIVSNRVSTQANEFVAAINYARSEAIKRNTSVSLCRVSAADAVVCAASTGNWVNWAVVLEGTVPAGVDPIVRRGIVNNFSGGVVVQSNLTGDRVVFGPDGLARTNGVLVDEQRISVCATRDNASNSRRRVVLGAGSRLSTVTFTGACAP